MKKPSSLLITLDGPSGSGKSTVAIELALHFNIPCLDTGAMYRVVGLKALQDKIDLEDSAAVEAIAKNFDFQFGFERVTPWMEVREGKEGSWKRIGKEIRTPEVSLAASRIAKLPEVRSIMVTKQREIGSRQGGVVEGRDAGTVIFPQATIKFFMTASKEQRARRRADELREKLGEEAPSYEDVLREMLLRDSIDEGRAASPSKPAEDAILLDTSGLEFPDVVQFLVNKVEAARSKQN